MFYIILNVYIFNTPNTSKILYPPKIPPNFDPPKKKIAHLAISRYPFLFAKNEKINAELFPLLKLHSQFFFLMSMCYNNFCSDTNELPILFVLKCIFIQKVFFPYSNKIYFEDHFSFLTTRMNYAENSM